MTEASRQASLVELDGGLQGRRSTGREGYLEIGQAVGEMAHSSLGGNEALAGA